MKRVSQWMVHNEIIKLDDIDYFIYGIELIFLKALHYCGVFLLAGILGRTKEVFYFIFAYTLLRSYAGGYHAKTRLRCLLISLLMTIIVALFSESINQQYLLIFDILLSIYIYNHSPVECVNNPLLNEEKVICKRRTGQILAILNFIIWSTFYIKISTIVTSFRFAIIFTFIFLYIEVARERCK